MTELQERIVSLIRGRDSDTGLTSAVIAYRLDVGVRTVANLLSNLLTKGEVKRRRRGKNTTIWWYAPIVMPKKPREWWQC